MYNLDMKKLHKTQDELLDILKNNQDEGYTIRELQGMLGLSTPSLVAHHLEQLEKKGLLVKDETSGNNYVVLDSPEKPVAYLSLFGLAQCGPKGSVLDSRPIDRLAISTRLIKFPVIEAFLVKAKGDSMEPKIGNGDIVLAKKTNAVEDGAIVVCSNNEEALIKRVHYEKNGGIILESLNSKYPPFTAAEDFRIEGEVKAIISHLI